jgi:hypothetical protein
MDRDPRRRRPAHGARVIRLEREATVAGQAGGALAIGLILTVLGGGMLWLLRSDVSRGGQNEWLFYVVGGGFSAVGLVMVILGVKMWLMTRLPETIVEVDRMPVRAGVPFEVIVRQPGPIRLKSLRLNVVGEQLTTRDVWRSGERETETERHLIHQNNVLDLRNLAIGRGEEVARKGQATVPTNVTLVDIEGEKTIVWKLEVWGRVRGWVDFGHPFVIEVSGGPTVVRDAHST